MGLKARTEARLVDRVRKGLRHALAQRYEVRQGAPLLYQVHVNATLDVTVDPADPKRGQSAFETDLCIFEWRAGVPIPRVVLEFKLGISTHDVLTYSAKAGKHKAIYPYLRYGIVARRPSKVPGKFFTHNERMDFCLTLGALTRAQQIPAIARLVKVEIKASRRMERIVFDRESHSLFRTEPRLRDAKE